jgi:hypothetical protein
MFDIRLREYTPAGVKGRVLPTQKITMTPSDSATPTLTFVTSAREAGRLEAPFVVGVEYSVGGAWVSPRSNLFIAVDDADDAVDETKSTTFTGEGYVPWLLGRNTIHAGVGDVKDGRRSWSGASAGTIMRALVLEGKGRGWGPTVQVDFSGAADSNGLPWKAPDDQVDESFTLYSPVSGVLASLAKQGLCEWWSEGMTLRVVRVGTGATLPNVVIGAGVDRAPSKGSFGDVHTHLRVVLGDSPARPLFANPGADTRFGRLEATMTAAGVSDLSVAQRVAQPVLTEGRSKKWERSYEWTPGVTGPIPFVDFNIGDVVTARAASGKALQRVVGMVLTKDGDEVSVRVVVGSKLLSLSAKLVQRSSAAAMGTVIGGAGDSIPTSPNQMFADPLPPTGFHVAENDGSWREDGTAQSTVVLAWDAVTQSVDGSGVDVRLYELAERVSMGEAAVFTSTEALSASVSTWEPGVTRFVKVRAVPFTGKPSAWSEEIAVTPAVPASVVPRPVAGLALVSNVGTFQPDGTALAAVAVEWDPVMFSVDDELLTIAEYELLVGLNPIRVLGTTASFTVPSGATADVRARALSDLGIWGDPSVPLSVTGAEPPAEMAAPTAPVLLTGLAQVAARWDGDLVTGAPTAGFGFVYMETASNEDGPWSPVGTPLTGAGGANIKATVGETVWVRLRSSDTLGRPGGISAAASIVVEGVTGPDIEANAVTANHVQAGSIGVNHVTPSFGDDLNIAANGSVTIIVGRQQEQDSHLADLDGSVSDAQTAANAATDAAGAAQSAADNAQVAADGAASAASDVSQRLDQHQTYYRFGTDGLAIGDPSSAAELRLEPDAIQMTQNGVVISEWVGGVLIAPEAKLLQASIANHQFMPFGAGRTIVRPL